MDHAIVPPASCWRFSSVRQRDAGGTLGFINSLASQSNNCGCDGAFAVTTEVRGRGDDSLTKVPQPNVIRRHARRQRIVRARDPVREPRRRPVLFVG
jgi:hypothetical protein